MLIRIVPIAEGVRRFFRAPSRGQTAELTIGDIGHAVLHMLRSVEVRAPVVYARITHIEINHFAY